jgi:putative intracellular protease/amidase
MQGRVESSAAAGVPELVARSCGEVLRLLSGATYACAPAGQCHVVADGRLVTGQNPASAAATASKMVEVLRTIMPSHRDR